MEKTVFETVIQNFNFSRLLWSCWNLLLYKFVPEIYFFVNEVEKCICAETEYELISQVLKNKSLWDDLHPRTEAYLQKSGRLHRIDDAMVKNFKEKKNVF